MKILYVFATLPIGGAEEHLRTVIKNLDSERFSATVCCIGDKGKIGEEIEALGFDLISLGRMKRKSWEPSVVRELARLISAKEIDIVHTHLFHANMYGRVAAFMARVPVVSTEHNVYRSYKRKRSIINRLLAKKTAKIIAVSRAVKDYIVERDSIDPAKVEVIYNGIELERFTVEIAKADARAQAGLPPDVPIVGSVGRLAEQKGYEFLIRAMVEVRRKSPDAKLVLVGAGPLEASLKKLASSVGLGAEVLFLGERRDVPLLLSAFDLYVLPSLWEGLGIAAIEAMASGLPIVASTVGGLKELVMEGENGYGVAPKDEEGLSLAIGNLLADPAAARALGENARRFACETFSAAGMVSAMSALYCDIYESKAISGSGDEGK